MKIPAQLETDNVDFRSFIPLGRLLSVREEWLCELPPFFHRWQVQVATSMHDCATQFCNTALELNARIERWGPQRAFVRATDNHGKWVAILSDVSTDAFPIALAAFDFCTRTEPEVLAGALQFATHQKELLPLAPLWNELFLSIVMTSVERSHDGGVKGSIQLAVDDLKWPKVQSWLEEHLFLQKRQDEWVHQEQNNLFVLRTPGKILCGLN